MCDWRSLQGLSNKRMLVQVGGLRYQGAACLAAASAQPSGLAGGHAPGNRLAITGDSARRAFLPSACLIILAAVLPMNGESATLAAMATQVA